MIEREFIKDGLLKASLQEWLDQKLENAFVSKIEVRPTPLVTRIIVHCMRPGVVIGRKGENIRMLTEEIKKRFGIENPQIEVVPVENPTLDARIQAKRIARALERGLRWKPLIKRVLAQIMAAGAKGAEIRIKGKLAGKGQKAKKARVYAGYMKKVGDPAKLVDYAKEPAKTRWGIIGVRVRIVRPDVKFPDEIKIPEIKMEVSEVGDTEDEGDSAATIGGAAEKA